MTISEPTYCSNSVEKTTTPPTMKTGGMSTTNNSFDKKEGQLIVYLMIAGSIMALIWNRNNVDAWLKLTNQFTYFQRLSFVFNVYIFDFLGMLANRFW